MTERHSFFSATLVELNRRKVLRTVGGYAVAVFVLLQLMDAAFEPLRLPEWLPTLLVIVLILGFPVVFVLAWHLELRSDGIYRTSRAGLLTRGQSAVLFSVMLLCTGGLASVFYQYYSGVFNDSSPPPMAVEREFTAPQNSIAVLPFADMSEEGDQAHMADGISEEILNLLARVEGLQVAARTSSFAFRDREQDIREIGRLLGVQTVLEGSVRTSGDRVRLTAQLINVEDGFHIWSKDYDRESSDLFAIQDEVAGSIATALVESFSGIDAQPASRSDSLAAAQAYRTGRLHWWRRTPVELQKAIELFAEALELDATFAPAYAAMADTWLLLALYGNIPKLKATEKAQVMIEKALELDPQSAEAFAALGLARWQIGQMDAAESAFRQAIRLNEDYIPAQLWLGGVLGEQGRYPEESLVLEQAMEVDPLNELLAVNYASNLSRRGRWTEGRETLRRLAELRPSSTVILRALSRLEIDNGNLVDGWRLAERAFLLQPDNPEDISMFAQAWLALGDISEAGEVLQKGLQSASNNGNLRGTHWKQLMIQRRYEEAEALVREAMAEAGENAPRAILRQFSFQLGLIATAREQYGQAHELLISAINEDDNTVYSDNEVMIISLAAFSAGRMGAEEQAEILLQDARRLVRLARINGVDDPGIYYTEAVLLAMQNQPEEALQKLEQAVDRGFRQAWVLEIDSRLEALEGQERFSTVKRKINDDLGRALAEVRANPMVSL